MPTVPRRDPASVVKEAPLPGVQFTGGATDETFGGGASGKAVGAAFEAFGTMGVKLAAKMQKDADDIVAQGLKNQAAQGEVDIKVKVSKMLGNDSARGLDVAREDYKKLYENIDKQATNPYIKGKARSDLSARWPSINAYAQTHGVRQMEEVDKIQAAEGISATRDSMINEKDDPKIIARGWVIQEDIIRGRGERQGWTKEVIQQKIDFEAAETKIALVNSFISEGNLPAAKAYYKEFEDELGSSPAVNTLKNLLSRETLLADAEVSADEMMELKDPVKVVKYLADINNKAERTAVQAAYNDKVKVLTATHNTNEATMSSDLMTGKVKTSVDLERYRGQVSDEALVVAQSNTKTKFFSAGRSKRTRRAKYAKFLDRYTNIIDDDIYDRSVKYANLRIDVMAGKGYLKKEQYDELITWLNPSYVKSRIEPKKDGIAATWKAFWGAVKQMSPSAKTAVASAELLLRQLHNPLTKTEDAPGLLRQSLSQLAYENTPEGFETPDGEPGTYTITGGDISMTMPVGSKLKPDLVDEDKMVTVRLKSDGTMWRVSRKKFNAKYMEEI